METYSASLQVLLTIIPIFSVIFLGWVARERGFIPSEFLVPANRLVYYISIPALIFSSISQASFHEQFDARVLLLTLLAATLLYVGTDIGVRLLKVKPALAGSFVQSGGHGNVGYVGLPIAFYYLGEVGLVKAGILCGFLMIAQNLLSVLTLQLHGNEGAQGISLRSVGSKLLSNPVIMGAMAGIGVSLFAIPVPQVVQRSLDILGGLAPPMALLLIGGSLSLALVRQYVLPTMAVVTLKLIVLPLIGVTLFRAFHVAVDDYLPALILLCTPTATVAYVMTKEVYGDGDFAVAAISVSTLLSSVTFVGWLTAVSLPLP